MFLVASEGLERTNRSALRCSFYLENKKYRFFGRSPLPMKGRECNSLCFANSIYGLRTNLCVIHGMTRVCSRFQIQRLLSQLLWTLGVTQHWKGCSPHKKKLSILVQIFFFGWIQSFRQWNLSKSLNVVICGSVRTLFAICRGVKVWAPSTWNVEIDFPSIEGFGISMATSSVCPFEIWTSIFMSFSGGGTSPPHWTNSVFTCGCALEHITILVCPLPSHR